MTTRLTILAALLATTIPASAGVLQRGKVQLFCHRTANRDMPENTLESLALAARMGCTLVEVDVRMTLDGELVLNHDGMLERLTDGMGDIETSTYDELRLYDYGGWMSDRFSPLRVPRFSDALRLARQQDLILHLDVKQKGEGPAILAALRAEGMLDRVIFGGEDGNADELKRLYPAANADPAQWFGPNPTAAQVTAAHAQGKFVVANFSDNPHQMDLHAMQAAVAAGVDAINVDYPRLGAQAIGRPVEDKLAALARAALTGPTDQRLVAIRELSHFDGFPTQSVFLRLLQDPSQAISRAAAIGLVTTRPKTPTALFVNALSSASVTAKRNAAWALGVTHAPATDALLPLLNDPDLSEVTDVLLALSKCPGSVPTPTLLPFLKHPVPTVRAAAALALATHQPAIAAHEIPALLRREEQNSADDYARYVQRGKPKLSQAEIDPIIELYRLHMKLIHALELLPPGDGTPLLTTEAFRTAEDSSHVTSVLAGYGLWDRIGDNPSAALEALNSPVVEIANRAEWMLTKAGPSVLPAVRSAITNATPDVRVRLIHVLAWQGDAATLPILHTLQQTHPEDPLLPWAIHTIEVLQFQP